MSEEETFARMLANMREFAVNQNPHKEYQPKPEDWFRVGKEARVGRNARGIGLGDAYKNDYDQGLVMEGVIQELYVQKSTLTGRDIVYAVLKNVKTKEVNYPPEEELVFSVEELEESK